MNYGEQFRVIYGTGGNAWIEQYSNFQQACEAAASVLRAGDTSQITIEKLEGGEWILARAGKQRR